MTRGAPRRSWIDLRIAAGPVLIAVAIGKTLVGVKSAVGAVLIAVAIGIGGYFVIDAVQWHPAHAQFFVGQGPLVGLLNLFSGPRASHPWYDSVIVRFVPGIAAGLVAVLIVALSVRWNLVKSWPSSLLSWWRSDWPS